MGAGVEEDEIREQETGTVYYRQATPTTERRPPEAHAVEGQSFRTEGGLGNNYLVVIERRTQTKRKDEKFDLDALAIDLKTSVMARVKQASIPDPHQRVEEQARREEWSNVQPDSNSSDEDSEGVEATSEDVSNKEEEVLTMAEQEATTVEVENIGDLPTNTTVEPSAEPTIEPHVDPIFIMVEEIESLRLILVEEEHFYCKISIRSRFHDYCKHIKECLHEQEMERFRETQFGHLIDVPDHHQHSSQLLWYFILRQVKVNKEQEMWMMVNKTPMRFSMEEYAMITGLNFAPVSDMEKLKKAMKNSRLLKKYFGGSNKVRVSYLISKLEELKNTQNEDKIKIAFFYFFFASYTGMKRRLKLI
ncbi:hypothetical protein TIFTF001_018478 [Ficus carica]|uniref:DUF1985 domain-containing protein n=1 Tax=Ficus carica TaxID=3494 RepID=A0AA88A749_FICCA|nr:hypothetical protein TIFTF001_018478 [Ficus carica]